MNGLHCIAAVNICLANETFCLLNLLYMAVDYLVPDRQFNLSMEAICFWPRWYYCLPKKAFRAALYALFVVVPLFLLYLRDLPNFLIYDYYKYSCIVFRLHRIRECWNSFSYEYPTVLNRIFCIAWKCVIISLLRMRTVVKGSVASCSFVLLLNVV